MTTQPVTTRPVALPPVAPRLLAVATAELAPRLRQRLDAAIERLRTAPRAAIAGGVRVDCGPEAPVTLVTGPSGVLTDADQVRCGCLLAPRCLHRVAVLSSCPVADPDLLPAPPTSDDAATDPGDAGDGPPSAASAVPDSTGAAPRGGQPGRAHRSRGPSAAQRAAAEGLWNAAAAVLAAGVPGAGAVLQAELLRATHSARLAGLPRAENAALRVVRGLRAARARDDNHRLADLVHALRELLLTAGRIAAGDADPALVGVARRSYRAGGNLRVYGVCREPVISATGYAGVVTHLLGDEDSWFSVADVQPGAPARATAVAAELVDLGAAGLTHARLARAGLVITGTTVSPDGRLGSGRGVRANPFSSPDWSAEPLARLFARPLAEAVRAQLAADDPGQADPSTAPAALVGADLVVVGAAGTHLLARELATTTGPLIRLAPANVHPSLAHLTNLRRLATRPGLRIRVVARLDPERATTLYPLAVGPVPGAERTLRLPDDWQGHADLGYDLLQGAHLPPPDGAEPPAGEPGPDPVATAPLWRVRRLVELAVAGGRRAIADSVQGGDSGLGVPLRQAGFRTAADLGAALVAESGRRGRDAFGRLTDPAPDRYAWAWVATATHLAATERALVRASWGDDLSLA
ncbi:hypothetical protein [Micromonospora sp. HM5-17]|uniref:hypothetical protein n=1 Tax=Micromonospora sp. HM5-17 TaxID=2487710 RepID=UPI0018F7B4D7|nr:hypothetical protein [Micromonospora sp. HM5-17]